MDPSKVPFRKDSKEDDGPPAYMDEPSSRESQAQLNTMLPLGPGHDQEKVMIKDENGSTICYLSNILATDPQILKAFILSEAAMAPNPVIRLHGYHTETVNEFNKKESKSVTDFDIIISVPETIQRNHPRNKPLALLKEHYLLDLYDREKMAYRGGRFRTQGRMINDAEAPSLPPTLEESCHLFCANSSKFKSFTLKKTISGRDEAFLRSSLAGIIRSTKYRGDIEISFRIYPHSITILPQNNISRWRVNNYIWWFCAITQLWLITWPLLFLMTLRWQVLEVLWPYKVQRFSHMGDFDDGQWGRGEADDPYYYVQLSEKDWIRTWTRAVKKAVESKTRGSIDWEYTQALNQTHEDQGAIDGQDQVPEIPQTGFTGAGLGLPRRIGNFLVTHAGVGFKWTPAAGFTPTMSIQFSPTRAGMEDGSGWGGDR